MAKSNREVKIFLFCLLAGSFSFLFVLAQGRFSSQAMLAQIDQPASQKQTKEEKQISIQTAAKPIKRESAFILETGAQSALSLLIYPEKQGLQPKILFEKEIDKKLPIASVSKLMTAVVALENYSLQSEIKISQEAIDQEGEAGRLDSDEILSVENLLYVMLIESSNDAAEALAENMGREEFIELMNQKAGSLGLENTFFVNPNGLDAENRNILNVSSALDLAKLIIYIQKNHPLIGDILSRKEFSFNSPNGQFHHNLASTNALLYNSQTLWGKTGYTKKANGCMINLIRPQSDDDLIIINVVLGADDRFYEMQRLTDWLNNSFIW
ncbi:MAG: serine hydrolase [Candidatus Paceibacterota bacterium]|jgi:D-alanyl-D-alanine carboxypeptidase